MSNKRVFELKVRIVVEESELKEILAVSGDDVNTLFMRAIDHMGEAFDHALLENIVELPEVSNG